MKIRRKDSADQKLIDQVYEYQQEHIFRFWNELSDDAQRNLLQQISEIHFGQIQHFQKLVAQSESVVADKKLEPADYIPIPQTEKQLEEAAQACQIGERALQEGRVAAFLVAGGQGTRLGFDAPKGVFPISPIKEKSLFQLHAEKILARSRRYGKTIPWYIMTSESNHQATVDFFEQNEFFGLNPDDVMFFRQEMVPALDPDGKLILDRKGHIFTNPNGHGGSLSALKHSGALQDMRNRGIDLIFYFQVDNVLVNIADPVFLGYHLQKDAEMSAKVVAKTDPREKVGVLGYIDGRLGVIEYSDLPAAQQEARSPDGSLKFSAGSIAIHVLNVEFVEKENEGGLRLPWHVAHKKIPFMDQKGNRIEPDEPNGYKFETFVFDALADATEAVILEVARKEEFSPVKNADGVDSPATARRDMINLYGKWLEQAGVRVPRDQEGNVSGVIEISPLYALDQEELASKIDPDLKFDRRLYLA